MSEAKLEKVESKIEDQTTPQIPSEPIITAPKKVKNPKRVAAGKKLAEISKEAKARKKALAEARAEEVIPYIDGESGASTISTITVIALAGLALTAVGTYYGYKTYWSTSFARPRFPSEDPKETKDEGLPHTDEQCLVG